MPVASFLAVGVGAALGAWLRWGLALWLNTGAAAGLQIPGGTLLANLGGGFLMGIALAWFAAHPEVDPAWRLLVTTGFLGGLTTFSTFSAESLALLQRGQPGWALAHSGIHLFGALACCGAGFWLASRLIRG